MLTSCAGSPRSAKPPVVIAAPVAEANRVDARPDPDLLAPCKDPVELRGYQSLNAGPVATFWAVDRDSLIDCRDRKAKVQDRFGELLSGLAGTY